MQVERYDRMVQIKVEVEVEAQMGVGVGMGGCEDQSFQLTSPLPIRSSTQSPIHTSIDSSTHPPTHSLTCQYLSERFVDSRGVEC